MSLINIFIVGFLTENIVLTRFLGICSFLGTSNKRKNSFWMGMAVIFVTVLASIFSYLIYNYILVPYKATYLRTLMFILIIACLVKIVEIFIKKVSKTLYKNLGIYLPLITTNCAVLGTVLVVINNNYNFLETLVFSFASSLGYLVVIYVLSTIRERLNNSDVPESFKGYPIALIVATIMALLFARFI